ncbi:ACT domain-containing protein [candidate division KSB1 bacterium]
MQDKFIIFVIGKDRTGIVAGVSEILYKNKFNIEDSSMTILEDHFAMILIISAREKQQIPELKKKFQKIGEKLHLTISIKRFTAVPGEKEPAGFVEPYIITLIGADKIGIVYRITKLIAEESINITDVRTEIIGQEKSPVYTMILEIEIPSHVKKGIFKSSLKKLGKDLNVEITLKPIDVLEL